VFYLGKGFFALRLQDSSLSLLLFLSNNQLISSLALFTGHNLKAFYLKVIFLLVKTLSLAF
jgi:hypothetical protein